jgi:hypothetical protein
MSPDDIISALDAAKDRAELTALLASLRLPDGTNDLDRGRVTSALIAAASRCWRRRVSA